MTASARKPRLRAALFGLLMLAAGGATTVSTAETVDPGARTVLRVCADPANMPFSSRDGAGFENKIATLFAENLGVPVAYTWFPQTIGFLRNTLNAGKCDLVLGAVADQEPLASTNPYYRSAYALVYPSGSDLSGVDALGDARLQGRSLGIIAGTPPATIMAAHGLLGNAKSFPLAVDRRYTAPAERMVAEIASGRLDAGVLWGPIAGYFARKIGGDLAVVPLLKETAGPQMTFAITMGVRHGDIEWKRVVNEFIARRGYDIDIILADFAVPLLK